MIARKLCSCYVDPKGLVAFNASRLLPLDKCPGIRPIGVTEVCRRVIGKAVLGIVKQDVLETVAGRQFCAGLVSGCEAAVHCMSQIFDDSEAALFVDATNAFNSLNRASALSNVRTICPALAPILINTYRSPGSLFVNGTTIQSVEGTTQGDPLGMVMYAIGVQPLIRHLDSSRTQQVWYADDSAAGGDLVHLRKWWDMLCDIGHKFSYFSNSKKTKLLIKPELFLKSQSLFKGTNITIVTDGVEYLGGAIGSDQFISSVLERKAQVWKEEMASLAEIAMTEPHAAFAAFSRGVSSKWQYFSCVTNLSLGSINIQPLHNLEDCIRDKFIPALIGVKHISTSLRDLLSLPYRFGGMNIIDPTRYLLDQYAISGRICSPLLTRFFRGPDSFDAINAFLEQQELKKEAIAERNKNLTQYSNDLKSKLDETTLMSLSLSLEKGASIWLSTLPLKALGFHLNKSAFKDAIHLRYGWDIPDTPSFCQCGQNFTLDHILSCPMGGFPTIRHNEVRDITASLLSEVCSNVTVEPLLQPLTGEQLQMTSASADPNARLDLSANGVWGGRFEKTFFDVRVFNPFAKSNAETSLPETYRRHEREKRRKYEQRINEVEHASFSPLVFASTGGMSKLTSLVYKRLAEKIAEKRQSSYPETMALIRCRLCFALLRSTIMCIRGSRSFSTTPILHSAIDLQIAESRLTPDRLPSCPLNNLVFFTFVLFSYSLL